MTQNLPRIINGIELLPPRPYVHNVDYVAALATNQNDPEHPHVIYWPDTMDGLPTCSCSDPAPCRHANAFNVILEEERDLSLGIEIASERAAEARWSQAAAFPGDYGPRAGFMSPEDLLELELEELAAIETGPTEEDLAAEALARRVGMDQYRAMWRAGEVPWVPGVDELEDMELEPQPRVEELGIVGVPLFEETLEAMEREIKREELDKWRSAGGTILEVRLPAGVHLDPQRLRELGLELITPLPEEPAASLGATTEASGQVSVEARLEPVEEPCPTAVRGRIRGNRAIHIFTEIGWAREGYRGVPLCGAGTGSMSGGLLVSGKRKRIEETADPVTCKSCQRSTRYAALATMAEAERLVELMKADYKRLEGILDTELGWIVGLGGLAARPQGDYGARLTWEGHPSYEWTLNSRELVQFEEWLAAGFMLEPINSFELGVYLD